MKRRVSGKALGAGLVPLAVVAAAGALPRAIKRKMRPPGRETPHRPGYLGLPGREVWLAGPRDKTLHGWWIPVAHEAPTVVVLHGWGANASLMLPFAAPLHHAGFHAFFLDARGHGFSDTDDFASMPRFAEDLEVALDWIGSRSRSTSIGIIGHSIGAGAAALVTGRRDDVAALVSVAGTADVWELMNLHPSFVRMPSPAVWAVRRTMERMMGTGFEDIAPERVMANVEVPTLVVHGAHDEVVPLAHAHRLVEGRGAAKLLVVPGATHGDLSTFEPHIGPILAFLAAALD